MGNQQGKPVVFTDQVNLNHFRLLRVVGKGAFGKVRIVERKDNGSTYALKYIRKDEVVRSESVRNIIRERRMLEHLNHPFLCNLRYSFQDVEYLYLVVDLMTGGDLRFHITRKTLTEEAVRFWIAELGCALRYIHSMGIVHRDVKPDNVLLDAEGHVHLADFNVASEIKPGKELTSKSGTLAYLAPEVYEGRGYGTEVDWWSLGVLFYECIYNKRPFEASNHELLGQKIVRAHVPFPATNPPLSNVCLHAISCLLEKDRSQRIGAIGWKSFWDNPFFRDIDFEALERKEIEPIFVPATDKTNFDATYDLEELLLEEAPLEARARRQKPRSGLKDTATEKEIREDELHRMIETLFEPFDFTLAQYDKERAAVTGQLQSSHSGNSGGKDTPSPQPTGTSPPRHQPHGFSAPFVKPPARDDDTPAMRQNSSSPVHILAGHAAPAGRSRASTQSPSGSPPLPTAAAAPLDAAKEARPPRSVPEYFAVVEGGATALPPSSGSDGRGGRSELDSQRAEKRRRGGREPRPRNGAPVDPWDVPADLPAISAEPADDDAAKRPSGMLGFLSRKKGRDRSPKAKERGVLGKEGARQIVGERG